MQQARQQDSYDIIADIGGTNARFALVRSGGSQLEALRVLRCADHPDILDAIRHYLAELEPGLPVARLCLAVAGPVETDWIDLPNNHWAFSRSALASELALDLRIINDFTAQLLGVLTLH